MSPPHIVPSHVFLQWIGLRTTTAQRESVKVRHFITWTATCFFIFPILCQRAPNVESRKSKLFNSSTVQCVVPAYNWFHVVVFYAWRSTMQWCFVALNSSAFFLTKMHQLCQLKKKKITTDTPYYLDIILWFCQARKSCVNIWYCYLLSIPKGTPIVNCRGNRSVLITEDKTLK